MVKVFFSIFLFISFNVNSGGPRWDDSIDINDPDIAVKVVVQQCHKSLINAPELLEEWCEKAIEMGYWRGLIPLSLHTGDGTRLVNEATQRVKNNEPRAYFTLASLYRDGQFVEKDLNKAISIYSALLALNVETVDALVNSAHLELAKLYYTQKNWLAVTEHAQYVIDNSALELDKKQAVNLLESAKEKALTKK
ncbi:hypothetical protein [Pseudoalteromonas ostreae]|uniref:hypothetical protein n=1 Tax=Pseudoalteromonas ostreae TaxID=2774154 RepID=UPI001B36E018|nr:hypothetical protein [Pseudoalteromonas ostreae]